MSSSPQEQVATAHAMDERDHDLRQFVSASGDVYWISDRATGQLVFVNPAAIRFAGVSEQALLSDPSLWLARVAPEDRSTLPVSFFTETAEAVAQAVQHGDSQESTAVLAVREYRMQLPDGRWRWLRERRFLLPGSEGDGEGKRGRLCGLAEDVTERKSSEIANAALLERERLARAEAEALARSKDQFLSVVSHELRSPLNAIRGWAYVLRQVGGLSPVQQRALDAIDRNTQAQARLVDDLLDSQRILLGTFALELHRSMLSEIVDEAVEEHRHAADQRHLEIRVDHDPSLQAVNVDVRRMRQAVGHLVSNAVKFTSDNGVVEISTRKVGGAVEIAVQDNGIGIEAEHLPKIFERFAQADGSNTRRQGGLGIGLSLTRQLVELHGGRVEASSSGKDQGSRFVIRLPDLSAKASPAAGGDEAAEHEFPLEGCKIMVVEDDVDSREMLELILRETHADLVTFDSARRAYDYLAALPPEERPDAVVSDIAMPGEDGYSFMRRVRSLAEPGSERKMVALALTAFARDEDRARSMRAGFDVHIGKPIDSAMLVETLRTALSAKSAAPGST